MIKLLIELGKVIAVMLVIGGFCGMAIGAAYKAFMWVAQ
jgi:hypothetical protein